MGRTYDPDELDVIDVELPARGGPPSRRPVARGRAPRRLQRASLVVAAAVILIGVVAAGGLLGDSAPTSPPDAAASDAACRAVSRTSGSPAFRLAGAPGDETGIRGLPGEPEPQFGKADPRWRLPGPELALTMATERHLRLILATGACAAEVEIEAVPAAVGEDPNPDDRWSFLRATLDPASHEFEFLFPADGDWVLRIVVRYLDDITAGDEARLVEEYFRVRFGDAPFASPSVGPVVIATPALPCGPTPSVPADAVVTLAAPGIDPVPGAGAGEALPDVEVDAGATIRVAVVGAACATSWTIDTRSGESITSIEAVVNADNDPARAAQNVWQFVLPAEVPEADLIVILRFGTVGLVERLWRMRSAPFQVPVAFVVAGDGRRVAADPGCGLFLERANGATIMEDDCASLGYDPGEALEVDALEPLGLEIAGWTIVGWSGSCGDLVTTAEGIEEFESSGCVLGGYTVDGSAGPPPIRFVVPPGDHVLEFYVTATSNGDRFNVRYYARVLAR